MHLVLLAFQIGKEAIKSFVTKFRVALDDTFDLLFIELVERNVNWHAEFIRHIEQFVQVGTVAGRVPRCDRAAANGLARIGHDQLHIQIDRIAKAFALRASSQRTVEVKQSGLW